MAKTIADGLLALNTKISLKKDNIDTIYMDDTSVTISPNTFYVWGEVVDLDLTLEEPDDINEYNEYMFQFVSGNTPTSLALSEDITWLFGNNVISANKTYQVSIVNNLAVLGEF